MRIVFFGSASIGFPLLDALLASSADEVVAVVTQPDRPVGRKLKLTACPVKEVALQKGLNVLCPEKVGSDESLTSLKELKADLFVVVAYGQYIPPAVLDLPTNGSINLHPSLLPKYRGSSPIQWALANGDEVTGVTILYISEKMDSGDIILQREVPIRPEDHAATLEPVLAQAGAELLMEAVEQIRSGTVKAQPQDEAAATAVRKLAKEDGWLDWSLPASVLNNRIRAFIAWPGCFCEVPVRSGMQRLKVLEARVEPGNGEPGVILDASGEGPLVAVGDGAIRLLSVQPAGKNIMDGAAYLRGYPLEPGSRLG
ncbi:MAG: methionyl-tRNA formyltransferase [Kiritimatiellales bacterium]|nr:methionyl-tRNA formyltransferase [Kiritimatiellales bacterium]